MMVKETLVGSHRILVRRFSSVVSVPVTVGIRARPVLTVTDFAGLEELLPIAEQSCASRRILENVPALEQFLERVLNSCNNHLVQLIHLVLVVIKPRKEVEGLLKCLGNKILLNLDS